MALEYAAVLRPDSRPAVFDALQLGILCNITLKRRSFDGENVFPPRLPVRAESSIFVDWTNGNDENSGTEEKPKKTIRSAVLAARQATKPVTILLRNGTHYLTDTVNLAAEDNDLTIQNFNGEEAWVSGGIPLDGLKWSVYNVTKPGPIHMVVVNGMDNIAGVANRSAPCSVADSVTACEDRCMANESCTSFTWHAMNKGRWAHQCCLRYDGVWNPVALVDHISGYKTGGVAINSYVADLSSLPGGAPADITGLRLDGKRVPRARRPNADPETTLWPEGWFSSQTAKKWLPAHDYGPAKQVNVSEPIRNVSGRFMFYGVGIGGPCTIYDPPVSYWCQLHPAGGGGFEYYVPSGLVFANGTIPTRWTKWSGAVIQAWRRAHWSSWMFALDKYDPDNNELTWHLGGFQGSRGGPGSDWYVDGVLDEMDAPTEWYYDREEKKLYYFHNATAGTPPENLQLTATQLKVYFNISGTQDKPVKNVQLNGLGFRDSAYTYLDPHAVPSGGDWALERMAAVFLQGTEMVTVNASYFERLDGNGIMLSGYNRNASLTLNEFAWMGASAMAAWGFTDELSDGGIHGNDGTGGNFPRYTLVYGNIVREVGIWEKQSSAWFQAKSAQNYLAHNIIFNLARAGVNINDGFGGGTEITENLIFNTCRESSDHGPINSWDRQPFVTTVRTGEPSVIPEFNNIHHNFLVSNYGGVKGGVDNDDGSTFYKNHHNFNVYGWGPKSGGGGLQYYSSIHAYLSQGMKGAPSWYSDPDYRNAFYNNTLIFANGSSVYISESSSCGDEKHPGRFEPAVQHDNAVYHHPGNPVYIHCGQDNYTIAQFQAKFHLDEGSKDNPQWPTDKEIITWGRELLGIEPNH